MLLQLVDFKSISIENLLRLGRLPVPGLNGDHIHREVQDALQAQCRNRTPNQESFRPKRRCLKHWSPGLGASTEAPGQKVLPTSCRRLCWHEGAIYALDFDNEVFCWKPGDPATEVRTLLGKGTRVTGIDDVGRDCDFLDLSVSPTGDIFVADPENERLFGFQNGIGCLVLDEFHGYTICCSPNGVLYELTAEALQKLEGSRLQTVKAFADLPEDLDFLPAAMFVTNEEVIYVLDGRNHRILRFNPVESFRPVVVGQVPAEHNPRLLDLFVTEAGTIYVADYGQRKVLAIRPGDETFTEVLECPGTLCPTSVLVQDRSLYVGMSTWDTGERTGGLYEYKLPPELQLE